MMLGADGRQVDLARARAVVTLVDGQVLADLRLMPGDFVGMERHFDTSAATMETNARLEHVLFMLWLSARRKHGYAADFDTWVDAVEDIDFASGGADPAGPGSPAP